MRRALSVARLIFIYLIYLKVSKSEIILERKPFEASKFLFESKGIDSYSLKKEFPFRVIMIHVPCFVDHKCHSSRIFKRGEVGDDLRRLVEFLRFACSLLPCRIPLLAIQSGTSALSSEKHDKELKMPLLLNENRKAYGIP